ncbi:anti-sigma factor family protein [Aeoliella sp.]|uniref:anti-sigma factor family protein n=1 Tax=Aeoliella sp. TaxID=2795800 RepID=UPI003CCBF57A
MHCLQFQERLQALLDSRQDPADDQAIRQHMANCPECEALAIAYTAVARVPAPAADEPTIDGLADRVMADLNKPVAQTTSAANSARTPWLQWAVALAACVLVAVGVLRQSEDVATPPGQPAADRMAVDAGASTIATPAVDMPGSEMFYRTGQGLASFSLVGMQTQGSQAVETEASSDGQLFRRALDTFRSIWPGESEVGPATQGETGYLEPPTYALVS